MRSEGCTVQAYADIKRLSPGLLTKWHVVDGLFRNKPEIHISYYDENGKLIGQKRRLRLKKEGKGTRFLVSKKVGDGRPHLYGLWFLPKYLDMGWVLLVEGESDCHAAWTHGIPCIGVPGANIWRDEWTNKFEVLDVYAWLEPDQGGEAFAKLIAKHLPSVRIIRTSHKDICDAHVAGVDIEALIDEARTNAVTPDQALADANKVDEEAKQVAIDAMADVESAEKLASLIQVVFHSQEKDPTRPQSGRRGLAARLAQAARPPVGGR